MPLFWIGHSVFYHWRQTYAECGEAGLINAGQQHKPPPSFSKLSKTPGYRSAGPAFELQGLKERFGGAYLISPNYGLVGCDRYLQRIVFKKVSFDQPAILNIEKELLRRVVEIGLMTPLRCLPDESHCVAQGPGKANRTGRANF